MFQDLANETKSCDAITSCIKAWLSVVANCAAEHVILICSYHGLHLHFDFYENCIQACPTAVSVGAFE